MELARRARAELLLLQVAIPLVEYVPGLSPFNRLEPPSITFPDFLREQAQQQLTAAIDRFGSREVAMTPAETYTSRAAGIVLSGAGSNGTLGLASIKQYGGVTLAQDPLEAQHHGMPQSAIAAGEVDFVLPAAEMPQKLIDYCGGVLVALAVAQAPPRTAGCPGGASVAVG